MQPQMNRLVVAFVLAIVVLVVAFVAIVVLLFFFVSCLRYQSSFHPFAWLVLLLHAEEEVLRMLRLHVKEEEVLLLLVVLAVANRPPSPPATASSVLTTCCKKFSMTAARTVASACWGI